jgi:Enhancer of polycomb-like
MALRRVNMRERPVTANKKMPVVKNAEDVIFDHDLGQFIPAAAGVAAAAAAAGGASAAAVATAAAIAAEKKEQQAQAQKVIAIPIPPIQRAANYDSLIKLYRPYAPPDTYVKCILSTGSNIITEDHRYDMCIGDLKWLQEYNAEHRDMQPLTEQQLDLLIEAFEKKAYIVSINPDCSAEFPLFEAVLIGSNQKGIKTAHVKAVYQYWIKKRVRLNKALMRQYQQPPPPEDPSPYIAFRPRETIRRMSHRNPKKNDPNSFNKTRFLRRDFIKLHQMVDAMLRRENLKKDDIQLQIEEFDAKLGETDFAKRCRHEYQKRSLHLQYARTKRLEQQSRQAMQAQQQDDKQGDKTKSSSKDSKDSKEDTAALEAEAKLLHELERISHTMKLLQSKLPKSSYATDILRKVRKRKVGRREHTRLADDMYGGSSEEEESDCDSDEEFFYSLRAHLGGNSTSSQSPAIDRMLRRYRATHEQKDHERHHNQEDMPVVRLPSLADYEARFRGIFQGRIGREGRLVIDRIGFRATPKEMSTNLLASTNQQLQAQRGPVRARHLLRDGSATAIQERTRKRKRLLVRQRMQQSRARPQRSAVNSNTLPHDVGVEYFPPVRGGETRFHDGLEQAFLEELVNDIPSPDNTWDDVDGMLPLSSAQVDGPPPVQVPRILQEAVDNQQAAKMAAINVGTPSTVMKQAAANAGSDKSMGMGMGMGIGMGMGMGMTMGMGMPSVGMLPPHSHYGDAQMGQPSFAAPEMPMSMRF